MPLMKKKCLCCGLEFETYKSQKMYCDRSHYLPCPICGKPVLKKDKDFTRQPTCCSKECTVEKNRRNLPVKICAICGEPFKPKSGVALICDKEHHVNCIICGKDMILTRRKWQDKIFTCSRACALEKLRRFYREKYGVDHPMQSSVVQAHHKAVMKAKYGVEHALQSEQFLEAAYQTNLERFGTKYACLREECQSVSPAPIISGINKKFGVLFENAGYTVEYEKRIESRPFDIYLKECNTLVEIDPTYSHNTAENHWGSPYGLDHQRVKTDLAVKHGYRCIHVFDWDATEKIVDIVRPKTKIYARKCIIKEVDTTECNTFLNTYHLQGRVYKQKFRYGLYYNDELVQVMTFGASRYDKKYDIELLRLCSKGGVAVVGGAERLFRYALNNNPEWKSIISYCDLAKFSGEVYTKLGMKLIRTTPPQVVWSKNSEKVTSMLLKQRGFDQLFKTNYGKGTSNEQLMLDNGWLPVGDCGQAVFGLRRD